KKKKNKKNKIKNKNKNTEEQVFQVGVDNVPSVTLAVLGLNVYLFLCWASTSTSRCASLLAWGLSPLHHLDDWHLYFNMASFLSFYACLLAVFSLLTGMIYLLREIGLSAITQDHSYSIQSAFRLKMLSNHYHPGGVSYVMGVLVANRYASWVELVLIHVTSPGTSFVGHLAGILVGFLYTAGPLKIIMKKIAGELTAEEIRRWRLQRIDHFD
ncbi:unnamed protein product, partial [Coregonus sp. 'balchen']